MKRTTNYDFFHSQITRPFSTPYSNGRIQYFSEFLRHLQYVNADFPLGNAAKFEYSKNGNEKGAKKWGLETIW